MNKLSENTVETIYQIADIHIPKSKERHEEYREIIKKLVDKIQDGLVVICGDIFHDGLSGEAIMLMKDMLSEISKKNEIVIFRGNHDQTSKSDSTSIDYVEPNIYKFETVNKIYLLDVTGEYEYGNVIFGYTDIYEEQIYKISKKTKKIKIGLWHGMVDECNNYGRSMKSRITTKDFEGYDYVMLGDIHKQQYMTKTIAYSGSLIQQNHGESIEGHGIIKWNLKKKTSEFIEIPNDTGYLTIKVKDDVVEPYKNPLKKIHLRIKYENTKEETIQKIKEIIQKTSVILDCDCSEINLKHNTQNQCEISESSENTDNIEDNNDDKVIERLIEYIKKEQNYDEEKIKLIRDELSKVLKEIGYNYDDETKAIKLKHLMFNNMYVFGTGNCIDYEQLEGIVNVSGKNGIGKSSSAINILLYAIFGMTESKGRNQYNNINHGKLSMSTEVELEVNGIMYNIKRRLWFKCITRRTTSAYQELILNQNGKDISGKTIDETNNKILSLIGKREDLTSTCIIDQRENSSFLTMTKQEKEKKISDLMKLDVYTKIRKSFDKLVRETKSGIEERKSRIYENEETREEKIKQRIVEITELIEHNKLQEIESECDKLYDEKIRCEHIMKNYEDKYKTHELGNVNKEECQKKILEYSEKIKEIDSALHDETQKCQKYKNIEMKKKRYDRIKEQKIKILEGKLKELYKKYTNIKKPIMNITKITKEIEKIQNEIENNDITKLSSENDELQNIITELRSVENKEGYAKYLELIEVMNKYKITSVELINEKHIKEERKKHMDAKCENRLKIIKRITNQIEKSKGVKLIKLLEEIQEIFKCDVKEYEKIIEEINEVETKIKILNDKIATTNTKVDNYSKYLDVYNECCKKEIILEDNKKLLQQKTTILENYRVKLNSLSREKQIYDNYVVVHNRNTEIQKSIDELEQKLIQKKEEKYEEYDEYIKIKNIMSELQESKNKIEKMRTDLNELINNWDEYNKYQQTKKRYDTVTNEHKKSIMRVSEINKQLMTLENEKGQLSSELKLIEKCTQEINEMSKINNMRKEIIGIIDGGYVDKIMKDVVLPEFQKKVNEILRNYVRYQLEIENDGHNIMVYKKDKNGLLSDANKMSGYETLMANIAFRIAINEIGRRKKISFMILDEVFSYCDESAVNRLPQLFEYLKDKYKFVIIISHNEQIKSYTDMTIDVTQENGYSKVCLMNKNMEESLLTMVKRDNELEKMLKQNTRKK
jgi:DNA repair exonuclease SbcCD ATPase subunit